MIEQLALTFELKAIAPSQRLIDGYAAVFGNEDGNGDIIDPGAFAATLAAGSAGDVPVFIGHQHDTLPVGIPIEIKEDANGLFTRTRIFNTSAGNDLLALAAERQAAGAPLGMSIGYLVTAKAYDGAGRRHIKSAQLGEYSFVAMPANDRAKILSLKSAPPLTDAELAIMNWEMTQIGDFVRREKIRLGMR